ncbi:heavy metal translocating P-type ATPase, partial [Listeria monocytogenes]|nr:heavy metal translocating P-type ATPase [Listeria monocytogenes]
ILYTDKTGTRTYGEFKVEEYSAPDDVLKEVIYMEQQSRHPIARAIVTAFKETDLSSVDHNEPVSEIAGSGIKKGTVRVGKPSAFSTF